MSTEQYRNYMGYLWYQKEDNVYTIGINEEGLEEIDKINSVELAQENEEIEADIVCGSVETDDGPLDIYSPVSGKIIEVNSSVIENPESITEDPYDAWLFKVESDEDLSEDDDDEDKDDDKDSFDDEDEEED